jgi:hypothetical protein
MFEPIPRHGQRPKKETMMRLRIVPPQDDTECVERRRLDRIYEDLQDVTAALCELVPEPWQSGLRAISEAATDQEIGQRQRDLVVAIMNAPPSTQVSSFYESERAPCPLCGGTRQDGLGFALPLGMERHLYGHGHGSTGCAVLRAAVRMRRMELNERHGRRFYEPFVRV